MIGREVRAPAGFWHAAGRPLRVARAVIVGRLAKGDGYRVRLFNDNGTCVGFARIKRDTARRFAS